MWKIKRKYEGTTTYKHYDNTLPLYYQCHFSTSGSPHTVTGDLYTVLGATVKIPLSSPTPFKKTNQDASREDEFVERTALNLL